MNDLLYMSSFAVNITKLHNMIFLLNVLFKYFFRVRGWLYVPNLYSYSTFYSAKGLWTTLDNKYLNDLN